MNEPKWMHPPRRLLLATDLSARSDRALDRAVQLAREWHADMTAMTVVETPERPDPLAVPAWPPVEDHDSRRRRAQKQLERDARSLGVPARIHIAHGAAAPAIEQSAAAEDADLIVTGMARNEPFGRFLLGSTVEQLTRRASQPVLVVRNRVHGKYRRITAVRFFAGRNMILYHAHHVPSSIS